MWAYNDATGDSAGAAEALAPEAIRRAYFLYTDFLIKLHPSSGIERR